MTAAMGRARAVIAEALADCEVRALAGSHDEFRTQVADAILAALVSEMGLRERHDRVCECGARVEANGPVWAHFMANSHNTHFEQRLVTDWQETGHDDTSE